MNSTGMDGASWATLADLGTFASATAPVELADSEPESLQAAKPKLRTTIQATLAVNELVVKNVDELE